MAAHALLSPSASERWLICTRSARLEEQMPESTSSYADEGTLAHAVGANDLELVHGEVSPAVHSTILDGLQADGHYSEDMVHHVKTYVDECKAVFERLDSKKGGAFPLIEEPFDLSIWAPGSFGTSDYNVVGGNELVIVDLKYGQGVPVSAKNNSQLKLYALGVYNVVKWMYNVEVIRMRIVQPRIDNTNEAVISISDLLEWAEKVVKPQAQKAFNGEGDFVPGEHCRFCKVKPTCRALANYKSEIAHLDFELPDTLTNEEVAEILTKADIYINWLNSVKDYALSQAIKGSVYPGYKIVEGRSNRIITDQDKVEALLIKKGFDYKEFLTEPKLKGIGELEKLLGKAKFETLLSKYVLKPKGAPALVRVTDNRHGINSHEHAVDDFKHLNFDNNG
jgi:hypothetical protein